MGITNIYRVFTLIGICFIVYEIVFIKKKQKNTTYAMFPFLISTVLWLFFTGCWVFIDVADSENKISNIPFDSITNSVGSLFLFVFFLLQVCLTVFLYLFLGKYAEYHIIYNPKKKRKPLTLNFEESYIVLYGISKIKKRIIYIRDIVVEESYYVYEYNTSKMFPLLGIIGTKEYLMARLVNGKTVKINCSPFFIYDATNDLLKLSKLMKIKTVYNSKQIVSIE